MPVLRRCCVTLTALLCLSVIVSGRPAYGLELSLDDKEQICLVGNALGERMQHHGFFDSLLHASFPTKQLAVRNLCFPGDEVQQRIRSLNFGSPDAHLAHSKASVVLFLFGYNESFRGDAGLQEFRQQLTDLIRHTRAQDYSGQGAPKLALISPIAFEATGNPHLPDGTEHNARIQQYVNAMRQVAAENKVPFVDLFQVTQKLFKDSDQQLTLNGFQLNEAGYRLLAPQLFAGLFGSSVSAAAQQPAGLRAEVLDKNFHWWHRYRAVNGYSIYGKRNQAGFDGTYRNVDVMERERAVLDQMCANRDQRIWQVAQGKQVAPNCDDSNTLPLFQPKSNVNNPKRLQYRTAEQQLQHFQLAPGYAVDLIASEEDIPELANPVSLNFDGDGRLWVATMPSYPQWQPKTKMRDKLLILTDRDADGRYHGAKVFADQLHQPTGFEIGHGGVFVAQQPDLLFLEDKDGDDRADTRVRRLVGFDTADSHHGLAAFEWGPGGGLYFQEGTFKQSQVETLHGVERLSDAGVWRYDPRSEDMRVFVSVPFANPWGHVFDRWGQNFIADASDGLNYWAAPMSGQIRWPAKHPGGWIANKGWDKLPLVIPRRLRPTSGCELVATRQFPDSAQGNYLLNNVITFQGVLQHQLKDSGAGYVGKEVEPLIQCSDANFRPVDLQFGPDGALYIVDWHNALIGHLQHNLRDPNRDRSHGRIWRVRYADRPLLPLVTLTDKTPAQLVAMLDSHEDRTRYRVRRELAARPSDAVLAAGREWLTQQKLADSAKREAMTLEWLWLSQSHHQLDQQALKQCLTAQQFQVRAAAVRVLSFFVNQHPNAADLIKQRLADEHPRVRLEAVRACSFFADTDAAAELVLEVLQNEPDAWIEYTLDETLRALEQ